ncbi:hypothetical protein [Paraburkholderia sp. IW21]|uniref:hypothetical protein n=1 Tax=Paraburkholderia sp. IW21 TaxID=3242488 RepID=UPI003521429D
MKQLAEKNAREFYDFFKKITAGSSISFKKRLTFYALKPLPQQAHPLGHADVLVRLIN